MGEKLRVGSIVPVEIESVEGIAVLTKVRDFTVEGWWFVHIDGKEQFGVLGTSSKDEFPIEESGFMSRDELRKRIESISS